MSIYKPERDWSDLEKIDKAVLISGVVLWLILSIGILREAKYAERARSAKLEIIHDR